MPVASWRSNAPAALNAKGNASLVSFTARPFYRIVTVVVNKLKNRFIE
jgi:hypothetical protein